MTGHQKKITLPNGLRVILIPRSGYASTVLVLVEAGSEYETKRINGISHFLEHLMFKGTVARPEAGMIARELDGLGAQSNAFTGQEYTGYWAKARNKNVYKLLEIVSDLYLHPIFNPDELERERGVVIEEMNMYEDMPMRRVHEYFMRLLYGDQPAGWEIYGSRKIIQRVTRDEIVRYRHGHYVAPKTIVVVAGEFSEKTILASVRSSFGRLPRASKLRKHRATESQRSPRVFVKHKESDQSHLVLGVRAFNLFDKRRYALQLLAEVLGGGMSSRLFDRIRNKLGAAYYVRADAELFLDHGYLAISAGVDHQKIGVVLEAILDELRRMKDELVEDAELIKTKGHLIGNFLMGIESSDELAGYYGGQEVLTKRMVTPAEFVSRIQAVTAEDIRRVALSLCVNQGLNLAVIGPYASSTLFKKTLRF